jgi:hypothetical protein
MEAAQVETQSKAWPDPDFTVKETAQIVKTSERSIWRWIATGRIRARRYSSHIVRVPGKEIARVQAMAGGDSQHVTPRPGNISYTVNT